VAQGGRDALLVHQHLLCSAKLACFSAADKKVELIKQSLEPDGILVEPAIPLVSKYLGCAGCHYYIQIYGKISRICDP
jgi:hypothetical protein